MAQKTSFLSRKNLLLWLTALTIVYQVIYQIALMHALQNEAADEVCDQAHASQSPHCAEVQLFRNWQQQLLRQEVVGPEVDPDYDAEVKGESGDTLIFNEVLLRLARTTPTPVVAGATTTGLPADIEQLVAAEVANVSEVIPPVPPPPTLEEQLGAAGADSASWFHIFKKTLQDAQQARCSHPDWRMQVECVQLMSSIAEAQQSEELARSRDDSLQKTMHQVLRDMCEEPHRRGRADCVDLLASIDKEEHQHDRLVVPESSLKVAAEGHAAWEKEFVEKAEHLHQELCQDAQRVNRKDCAKYLSKKASATWSRSFMLEVRAAQRELCQEPRRRDRSDCIQLLDSIRKAEHEEVRREFREHSLLLDSSLKAAAEDHQAWEREVAERAHRIHRELCLEPSRRGREDCVKFLALSGEAQPSSSTTQVANTDARSTKSWSRDFVRTVRAAQREMCHEPHRIGREDCRQLLRAIAKAEHEEDMQALREQTAQLNSGLKVLADEHAAWERNFAERAREVQHQLCMENQHWDRKECAEFKAQNATAGLQPILATGNSSSEDSSTWSQTFMQKIRSTQREMCMEPRRRGRADCVALLASIAADEKREADEHHASSVAMRARIEDERANWTAVFQQNKLRRDAGRQLWERELLDRVGHSTKLPSKDGASTASAAMKVTNSPGQERTSLRQGHRQLHWSSVTSWSSRGWLQRLAKGPLVLERSDLNAARWAGMIPKVTCITSVASGPDMRLQMEYFIKNFQEQTYEGPSQLIMVYPHKDTEAAVLLRRYVDGSRIRAVAAVDDGPFPSTMALRYGAWSAGEDAQVIVQWDFAASHDRQRLSLQVRALAHSSRPGCLLGESSSGSGFANSTLVAGAVQENTLAGEAKWMQRHWHPLLAEQKAALLGLQDSQIVLVNLGSSAQREAEGTFAAIRESITSHFTE